MSSSPKQDLQSKSTGQSSNLSAKEEPTSYHSSDNAGRSITEANTSRNTSLTSSSSSSILKASKLADINHPSVQSSQQSNSSATRSSTLIQPQPQNQPQLPVPTHQTFLQAISKEQTPGNVSQQQQQQQQQNQQHFVTQQQYALQQQLLAQQQYYAYHRSQTVPQIQSQMPQLTPVAQVAAVVSVPATQAPQVHQIPQPHPPHTVQSPPKLEKISPGTILAVGKHHAKIANYLSEGGFAQIYTVSIDPPEHGTDVACLKRVIVPDKEGLNRLRAEVEVMKRLSYCKHVVRYYDSNAARIPGPTNCYEVLVLMELCPNKSLLDYMNSRLATKLTEREILQIMLDITQAVYAMHSLHLIHRDIKIENVLINADYHFKLCDFGSACSILSVPQGSHQFKLLQNELMHQTTPQYRSPEMIDLYSGLPVDEKSDIWALGVFLYKLCYYTTPFETAGELAILHAAYAFPVKPDFSVDLKRLISLMLQENPKFRPNIYQVLVEVIQMSGSKVENFGIKDLYGAGSYLLPEQKDTVPPIEPFTASKVPVFSPFTDIPRDFSQITAENKGNRSEISLPPPQESHLLEVNSGNTAATTGETTVATPATTGAELTLPGAISKQSTSTSTASLVDNAEERFPDIGKEAASTISLPVVSIVEPENEVTAAKPETVQTLDLELPNIVVDGQINDGSSVSLARLNLSSTNPKKRWSAHNPFPTLASESKSAVWEDQDFTDFPTAIDSETVNANPDMTAQATSEGRTTDTKQTSYNPFN
ncbi:hypothetical protein FOA43_001570 [Brettanomyces nanus]|uniref:Protein kinase domain-containing protein n=1 Tax=Eeniella nana TaxID=13502 RepID=A0A875S1N5_EENNA|nr:uncharacterized protein FOA43_001570 [Brettanomyces nanus]QPG74245.1 hypothetical protein FOA43_001570 [Brettanomyces nanus]